jgi:hypothetical protein
MADELEPGGPPDDNEEHIEITAVNQPLVRPALSKTERAERKRIVDAIEQMTQRPGWPAAFADFSEAAREVLLGVHVDRSCHFPKQLVQLPDIRPEQSLDEWKLKADEVLQKFRDDSLREYFGATSVDDPAPLAEPRQRRGHGKTRPGKIRSNTAIQKRYELAALRWMGFSWKSIAEAYRPCKSESELSAAENTVAKAGNEILRDAGLLDQANRK